MKSGLARISDLFRPDVQSTLADMEGFRSNFESLLYGRPYPWHWSRQWEYPFAYLSLLSIGAKMQRILDAGSGLTFLPFFLDRKGFSVQCADIQQGLGRLYEQANAALGTSVAFMPGSIARLPFASESFDVVLCISVLEHVSTRTQAAALREFHRILRPSGVLILTKDVTRHPVPFASLDYFRKHLLPRLLELFDPVGDVNLSFAPDTLVSSQVVCAVGGQAVYVPSAAPGRVSMARVFSSLFSAALSKVRYDRWGLLESSLRRVYRLRKIPPDVYVVGVVATKRRVRS